MTSEFNKTYTYSFFFRMLYRFGNILATLILLMYLIPMLGGMTGRLYEYFYSIVLVVIIIMINLFFLRIYRTVPFTITVQDSTITASDFFLSNKKVVINISDITSLLGGVFEGKNRGMMRILTANGEIAFFHSITDGRNLLAYILSQVPKDLYEKVLGRFGQRTKDLKK